MGYIYIAGGRAAVARGICCPPRNKISATALNTTIAEPETCSKKHIVRENSIRQANILGVNHRFCTRPKDAKKSRPIPRHTSLLYSVPKWAYPSQNVAHTYGDHRPPPTTTTTATRRRQEETRPRAARADEQRGTGAGREGGGTHFLHALLIHTAVTPLIGHANPERAEHDCSHESDCRGAIAPTFFAKDSSKVFLHINTMSTATLVCVLGGGAYI